MTEKVRKRINSRSGNGAPASVSRGSASAAARETAPRIPAQERKTAPRQFDIRRVSHWRVQHRKHPRKAQADHRDAHERGIAEEPHTGDVAEGVDDDRQLQADQHEEEGVQHVLDDLPDRQTLQANLGGGQLGVCQPR